MFVYSLSLNLQLYEYGRASVKVSCSLECLRVVTDAFPCINKAVRFVSVLLQQHRRSSFRDKRPDSSAELLKQSIFTDYKYVKVFPCISAHYSLKYSVKCTIIASEGDGYLQVKVVFLQRNRDGCF